MSKSIRLGGSVPLGRASRPKRAAFGAVVALSFIGIVGCSTPSNTPTAYDSTVEDNFIDGCTATAPPASTGETGESLGQGADEEYCQCAYNWFVNNVQYDAPGEGEAAQGNPAYAAWNFKSLNSDLADDPNSMPPEIQTALADACGTSAEPKSPGTTTPTTAGEEIDPDNESTTTSVPG